jgi:tetratricopeptide (TPR) repeat protein
VTTEAELTKAWGEAKEVRKQNGTVSCLYSIPPFNRIEVMVTGDKVASILIRLDKAFPANLVAKQLDLTKIRSVLVLNEMGEVLGQSYPERGVVLAFEPGSQPSKPSTNVVQIILESVTAEPFVLRAETNIDIRPELTRRDCDQAIKLQPTNARARWLRARVLAAAGEIDKAVTDATEAARLEPENAQYRVTLSQVMGQGGMFAEAIREAEKAIQDSGSRPHVKARANCLLGDLYASSTVPDYKLAMARHTEAIRLADPLAESQHPAIRLAAKEVLIDAHLGAAHDIAWGNWKEKDKAIPRWLDRATTLADELVKSDGGNEAYRFHVSNRALAACVGARGVVDPSPWAEDALRQGRALISKAQDPIRKSQYQWDLGMALYDALQVCQLRAEHDTAMKYGENAIEFLEQSQQKQSPSASYLLGRLYFRMGAVCALRDHNHQAAVRWFEKALPLLDKPLPSEAQADLGRHGETFVSMGVSYWETGRRDRGVELTQRGVNMMEQAVQQNLLDNTSLAVAYTNLSIMHRKMGQLDNATRFESMANEQKRVIQR